MSPSLAGHNAKPGLGSCNLQTNYKSYCLPIAVRGLKVEVFRVLVVNDDWNRKCLAESAHFTPFTPLKISQPGNSDPKGAGEASASHIGGRKVWTHSLLSLSL